MSGLVTRCVLLRERLKPHLIKDWEIQFQDYQHQLVSTILGYQEKIKVENQKRGKFRLRVYLLLT